MRAVVLEVDHERRRIKLGIKQLEPTTADEYIAEHQVGESVTGRIVEAPKAAPKWSWAMAFSPSAGCARKQATEQKPLSQRPVAGKADLGSLTAMLSAKWKQGPTAAAAQQETPRAGQVRTFRILKLDLPNKKIEVELAG